MAYSIEKDGGANWGTTISFAVDMVTLGTLTVLPCWNSDGAFIEIDPATTQVL
jgi:hypothetical protein